MIVAAIGSPSLSWHSASSVTGSPELPVGFHSQQPAPKFSGSARATIATSCAGPCAARPGRADRERVLALERRAGHVDDVDPDLRPQ